MNLRRAECYNVNHIDIRKEGVFMPTIVSLLTQDKFALANISIPEGYTIHFPSPLSDQTIINACKNSDCLFAPVSASSISAFVLANIPSIKLIQTMGVGFDHIDIPTSKRLGIPVANVPGANATSVAEHTIGSLIALQRRLVESDMQVKSGNYAPFRSTLLRKGLQEIFGCKIGLVGFGNIGRWVAKAALALGATVSYYAPHRLAPEVESQFPVEYKPLDILLSTSDVVSLHLPLNDQTRGLIGAKELDLMPPGSFLINTARGEILDQCALVAPLESGRLAGVALDTISPEPPTNDHPLLHLSEAASKRLLITPHTAGVTLGAYQRMIEAAMENMSRVIRGEPPVHIVNGIDKRLPI
jgi:phosphoglycerate dehydrogenase-like enzyme